MAKEGDIKIKEGHRFIFRNGVWRREGRGEFGSQANTREANRLLREMRKNKPIGYAARKKAEKEKAKVKPDPNGRSSRGIRTEKGNTVPTGSQQYNDYRRRQIAEERERLKNVGNPAKPPKPTPKPQASRTSPAGKQPSRPATPAAPKKPASPNASKERRVSAATANRQSGNYGTSRTNNPMIDDAMKARMRRREERQGVGPVKDGNRYAADVKNSTKGVGPVKDGNRYASNLKPSKKSKPEKKMTLAERMRRRRQGLA